MRFRLMCALAQLLLAIASSSVTGAAQQMSSPAITPPASEIAAALQRKYDTLKDFSASFTQTYEGGVLGTKKAERGTVYIKKPGRMRWEYTAPQKKLFVSDGQTMYMHFPADRQVIQSPVPQQDRATSAALFLMGKGDIPRDFNVRYGEGGTDETWVLRLDPKTRQTEYDWLEVAVDRKTLQIRSLTAGDAQGGRSTFAFTDFKENPGVPDKMFRFSVPRGTEVITSERIS